MNTSGTIVAPKGDRPVAFIDRTYGQAPEPVRKHLDAELEPHVIGLVFADDGEPFSVAYGLTRDEAIEAWKNGGAATAIEKMEPAARTASLEAMRLAAKAILGVEATVIQARITDARLNLREKAGNTPLLNFIFNELGCYLCDLMVIAGVEFDPHVAQAFALDAAAWMQTADADVWPGYMESHAQEHIDRMQEQAVAEVTRGRGQVDPKDLN